MKQVPRTILLFGDYTESWIDSIDSLCKQADSTPWLQSFLNDIVLLIKDHKKDVEPFLQASLGDFTDLQDLADRWRHTKDELSFVQGLMLYTVRAAFLLQWMKRETYVLDTSEIVGFSGGLVNASVLAVARDFDTLYRACLEGFSLFTRSCRLAIVRSRAIEDRPGSWGWVVMGISASDLRNALDRFQNNMGIPMVKRAKIGLTGDRWSTVIGPPSVLELFFRQCPAVRALPKDELNIHALQHALELSETDLDYILGDSPLLNSPIYPGFKLWGMKEPEADYDSWGHLLRAMILQVLALPLDIVQVVGKVNRNLGSYRQVIIKNMGLMGPSSHATYLVSALKASGGEVTFQNGMNGRETGSSNRDRIAIVGMAGQGPGCGNIEEFWNVILNAQDLHQEIPKDRFDLEQYLQPGHATQCASASMSKYGCFIKKPGNFDSRFFHISPREAVLMEPGHRLFLMSAYEALEMAGYSNGQTRVTDPNRISIFFGQCNDDWRISSHDVKGCDSYTLPGTARAFGPGRIAFHFGWEGPTYCLDSACSSSCSSINLACMSLLSKDTDMAVAGAANVIGYPHTWISLSQSGVLSRTGNCKPFRDDADGYCRADFVGAVVLKRLEDAVAHNDNILAVIAGSGRNHSGNATSITTSDAGAQERLFRKVLRNARVSPHDISYVEMHGTGTPVGDPAEMGAVASVFRQRRKEDPLSIGAVKGNVGHSESAAGMSSLLKCILIIQKDVLPPQVGMPHALNPKFPSLSDINVVIPSQSREFKARPETPRRILLNNFDAAGGNGCLLLEDYVSSTTANRYEDPRSCHVIVSSAKTPFSLSANKRNLLKWLRANPETTIEDIAYTTTARRTHWPIRYACTASTTQDLVTKLESNIAHDDSDAPTTRKAPVVFVFTGQGSDYAGMGAELYLTNPVFRGTVDLCVRIAQDHKFPSFIDIITDKTVDLSTKDPVNTQLALLTLEIGLAAFWKSLGVQPDMVVGHSLGEYAALHVAGVLSLADVLYLVGRRALLLLERCDPGSCTMLTLVASATTVQEHLAAQPHSSCAIACVNGPSATVVSGPKAEVAQLQNQLAAHNIRSRILSVPFAFHSLQMDPMLSEFATFARAATFAEPKIPVASTLLASVIGMNGTSSGGSRTFSADYLAQQTRQKVDFVGALGAIKSKLDHPIWLEIGPSQVCGSFVRTTLSLSPSKIMSTLEAGASDWASISKCLARVYENGVEVDWLAFHTPYEGRLKLLTLPSYAWDLKDYWIPYTEPKSSAHAITIPPYRETVDEGLISTCAQSVVQESISPKIQVTLGAATAEAGFKAFIDGHRLRGVPVCAGAVFIEAALAAGKYLLKYSGRKTTNSTSLSLRNMSLNRPITEEHVRSNAELLTTASMESPSADTMLVSFKVSSSGASQALGACTLKLCDLGRLEAVWDKTSFFIKLRMDELITSAKNGHGHRMQSDIYYALFADTVEYDAPFKGVKDVYVSKDFEEAAAEVLLQNDPPGTKFTASPYWADSLTQLAGFVVNGNPNRPRNITFMMASFESYEQTAAVSAGKSYFTYVRVTRREKDTIYCDAFVFDERKLIIQCSNCIFHEMNNGILERLLGKSKPATSVPGPKSHQQVPRTAQTQAYEVTKPITVGKEQTADTSEAPQAQGGIFNALLDSIVKATGGDKSELTDDAALADIGVDSIMAIEIAADFKDNTGADLLPSFVVEYPTIGHLSLAFSGSAPSSNSGVVTPSEGASSVAGGSDGAYPPLGSRGGLLDETSDSKPNGVSASGKENQASMTAKQINGTSVAARKGIDDDSPAPRVRISLMQGRPAPGKPRFYIIADGSGTIATYIHLPPVKIDMPVYGIDSPFLHCPSKFTPEAGIPEVAMHIVEALIMAQPEGPFFLGGFSGGAMISYEVSRQLAALGRKVEGLVLIDMCCPRPKPAPGTAESIWNADIDTFESVSAHAGPSTVANNTQQHLRAIFKAVSAYHPPPMTANERPARTTVIWAEKGMISRCYDSPELMKTLAKRGLTAESRPGFMEDPCFGAIRWSILNKGPGNLGPNGWEKFIGYDPLCFSVKADHLEMVAPGQVHLLRDAIEQAFRYLSFSD